MQKLKKANLYRSELIPVSGKLVERYNLCLEKLGFFILHSLFENFCHLKENLFSLM